MVWRHQFTASVRQSDTYLKGEDMKYCPKCKASYPLSQRFCSNEGAALTLHDPYNLVGSTLADKYRLDALVGIGGMGAVYFAIHRNTGRQIAVKILLPNLAIGSPRLVELFEREALIVGRLKHENIVDIIDAGRTTESIAYIAMEWLEGYTLRKKSSGTARSAYSVFPKFYGRSPRRCRNLTPNISFIAI